MSTKKAGSRATPKIQPTKKKIQKGVPKTPPPKKPPPKK